MIDHHMLTQRRVGPRPNEPFRCINESHLLCDGVSFSKQQTHFKKPNTKLKTDTEILSGK